jgi:hypothetical protein
MTDHCVQFERTAGGMMLTNAILLYRSDGARGLGSHLTLAKMPRHSPASIRSTTLSARRPSPLERL